MAASARSGLFSGRDFDPEARPRADGGIDADTAAEVEKAVLRAVSILSARENVTADIEPGTAGYIASVCGGDVRKALNAVELLFSAAPREGNTIHLLRADAENITQRSAMHYDRAGDDHYDVVSALMKSLRGSDPDAALHYLARLLEAGDLIGACRRILCSASEDIGLAYPQAAMIVGATSMFCTISSTVRPAGMSSGQ